ncbi:MAG: glycosyltransferase [Candidatus Riflebacteria bacterium]|nr:glycosyltransferase [Candidatus Riflebacteria bacterium]
MGLVGAIVGFSGFLLACRLFGFAGRPAVVALFGLGAYVTGLGLFACWLAHRRWRGASTGTTARSGPAGPTPGVSILKPLCGVDDGLEANLESFLGLAHEPLQLLFGTRDADDPAMAIARAVAARHPDRDVTFVAGIASDAANPKIAIDEHLLPLARHPLVLLSDSNVRVAPGDLTALVDSMADERVGMVYQPVVSVGERDWVAALANLRFTEHSGVLAIATRVFSGADPITGKGMLCRRAALASIGDLAAVRDVGLDDYLLGVELKRAGWRLHMATVPALNVFENGSWRSFFQRQVRHAIWRFSMSGWLPLAEILMMPLVWSVAALFAGGPWAIPAALGTVAAKSALEDLAIGRLRAPGFAWRHKLLMPLKDVLMVVVWVLALFRHTVVWRDRTYRVDRSSRLYPVDPVHH